MRRGWIPSIDTRLTMIVIYQDHNYNFYNIKRLEQSKSGAEFFLKNKLLKNKPLSILDSTYYYYGNSIQQKNQLEDRIRYWYKLPIIFLGIPFFI